MRIEVIGPYGGETLGYRLTCLLVGDHILVDKLVYAPADRTLGKLLPYDEIERGDIVVFVYPLDPKETYVKRAIGLPGERLRIVGGQVFVNGQPLDEPYKRHIYGGGDPYLDNFPSQPHFAIPERGRAMLREHVRDGELLVPAGAYFCMGDNRDNSADSRFWGFVPRENIQGSPAWIYWSYESTTERLLHRLGWAHWSDVARNFFSKTRWERTLNPVR